MGSMKEAIIREYFSKIDFNKDDWKLSEIKSDMRKLIGEEPGIDIIYKKDVMINEILGTTKEILNIDKIQIIWTDTDDKFKKIEFILGNNG
jgi:hypothetical protein